MENKVNYKLYKSKKFVITCATSVALLVAGYQANASDTTTVGDNQPTTAVPTSEVTGTWGTATFTFSKSTGVLTVKDGTITADAKPWENNNQFNAADIKEIHIAGNVVAPTVATGLFANLTSLTNFSIDSSAKFDTTQTTLMDNFFTNDTNLVTADLSTFDTSKVTNMQGFFYKNISLTTIKGIEN